MTYNPTNEEIKQFETEIRENLERQAKQRDIEVQAAIEAILGKDYPRPTMPQN